MPKLLDLATGELVEGGAAQLALAHDTDIMTDAPALDGVSVIAVDLPKFKDGRAFTQIRVLRDRYRFEGEIRVTGHVIPDQAQMLARVGASTVELTDESRLDDFRTGLRAYRYAYQRAAQGDPAFALRGAGS